MNDASLDDSIDHAFTQVKENVTPQSTRDAPNRSSQHASTARPVPRTNVSQIQSPAYIDPKGGQKNFASQQPAWWGAVTGFPLIAATFGPIANTFSICALVETWRARIPPGGTSSTGVDIPDPGWVVAVNAVSLACALVANIALLLTMARRLRFAIAQPITIIGFWISSVILIALVILVTYVVQDKTKEDEVLTQAYFFACWAAGIYQGISYLMCISVYVTLKRQDRRDFNLTTAQRSLMLQTILFLAYLLLGSLVYSKIEGWKYTDAVYWATFTLLTIGIGDFVPTSHLGRSLLFPFALGGIVFLGLIVSSIRSLVINRGKANMSARLTDNMRRRLLREIEILQTEQKDRGKRLTILSSSLKRKIAAGPSRDADDEYERRQTEFEAMRRVQHLSDRRQKWFNLLSSATAWSLLWFIGALVFMYTENQQDWSYFVSLYFCYTTLLTIGYGDFYPVTDAGKAFFVFWALLAVPLLTILISDMGDTVVKLVKDTTIYIGEVTILPSDKYSIAERLRYGLGKIRPQPHSRTKEINDPSSPNDSDNTKVARDKSATTNGLANMKSPTISKDEEEGIDAGKQDRIASGIEQSERSKEEAAHERGDVTAENEHHYRRLLITQIRRVHTDTTRPQPKKYAYHEWAFFLKLLGEDESESGFHRMPRPEERNGQTSTQKDGVRKWSWIGPQSPLLSDKDEPTLLLELLFERLERSLDIQERGQ